MNPTTARLLDANANRAREALRVLEDYARFALNDQALAAQLKAVRHGLAAALATLAPDALLARDTPGDVGTTNKTAAEFTRRTLAEVVIAAGKRLAEALRVVEEVGKTVNPAAAADVERLRYAGYTLEQTLTRAARQTDRFGGVRLYVLLTAALCKMPWERTLDAVLAGGAECVQLREKALPDGELLRRARHLVARCRAYHAVAIINDRPDIALLAGADGVHVGQDDLPCAAVRALAGHDLIVGVSTERLEEAQQAVRDGATYVGIGPMFTTTTKEKPRLAGPAYAREAVATLPVPCVAIGGITADTVPELIAVGVRTVAVCSGVIAAGDPAAACRQLRALLVAHGASSA
jgi:thiamine-phosphate pyrophosphorylase